LPDTVVVIHRHDEAIALAPRPLEVPDVPHVEQIKTPVRKRNGPSRGPISRHERDQCVIVDDASHER
jgi:hypothetical protein